MEDFIFKVPEVPLNKLSGLNKERKNQFLPQPVVKFVLKVSNLFELNAADEFSLLETLQHCLRLTDADISEGKMRQLMFHTIRITQKFNSAEFYNTKPKFSKELDEVFGSLGIAKGVFTEELKVLKSLDYTIKSSQLLEMVHQKIEEHLDDSEKKPFLFMFATQILRFVYLMRENIYTKFHSAMTGHASNELKENENLLASAVILTTLRAANISDREHNRIFDALVNDLGETNLAGSLNQLAAVVFDMLRNDE